MKRKIKLMAFVIIFGTIIGSAPNVSLAATSPMSGSSVNQQNLQDLLLTLLTPDLDQAVRKIYGEPKQFDLFNAKIEQIGRPKSGGFHFVVKVTIQTFEGAHNPPYGQDTFTFDITPGQTTLIKTDHHDFQARL